MLKSKQHIIPFFALNFLFSAFCFSQTKKIVVDVNGRGNFKSIQAAINSLSDSSAIPRIILIKNGTYHEKIYIQKHNIVLQGEDRDKTIIIQNIARDEWQAHSGMVIVPTELVSNNGKKLESIVLELAHLNGLEEEFIEWLENHNNFCNSLVDRIVPGKPDEVFLSSFEDELGYRDSLLITSEDYAFWAIEGNDRVKEILSFAVADSRVIIKENIDLHRELKLRLLNGTHTMSCGVAFLAGCKTVRDAMDDKNISSYIIDVMQHEIASAIPYDADSVTVQDFALKVLTRFRNPYLRHRWLSIAMNYSTKMKLRCTPVLMKHYERTDEVPGAIALGFAAYIYFMKAVAKKGSEYYGEFNGESYLIQDDLAEIFYKRWTGLSIASLVQVVISDAFWGVDMLSLPGFKQSVIDKLNLIINNGMKEAVESVPSKKTKAA